MSNEVFEVARDEALVREGFSVGIISNKIINYIKTHRVAPAFQIELNGKEIQFHYNFQRHFKYIDDIETTDSWRKILCLAGPSSEHSGEEPITKPAVGKVGQLIIKTKGVLERAYVLVSQWQSGMKVTKEIMDAFYMFTALMVATCRPTITSNVAPRNGQAYKKLGTDAYRLLNMAISSGNKEIIVLVLYSTKGLDVTNENGQTALHLAAAAGNEKLVLELLSQCLVDPCWKDKQGQTALACAPNAKIRQLLAAAEVDSALGDRINPTEQLSKISDAKESKREVPNSVAADIHELAIAESTNKELLALLQKPDAKVNALKEGITPLQLAVFLGNTAGALTLLQHGADINAFNATNGTALMVMSATGDTAMVRFLLENGVDVNMQARKHAWYQEHNPQLLTNPDMGIGGRAALHYAVENGRLEVVELLLEKGADPNLQDEQGRTAFNLINGDAQDRQKMQALFTKAESKSVRLPAVLSKNMSISEERSVPQPRALKIDGSSSEVGGSLSSEESQFGAARPRSSSASKVKTALFGKSLPRLPVDSAVLDGDKSEASVTPEI